MITIILSKNNKITVFFSQPIKIKNYGKFIGHFIVIYLEYKLNQLNTYNILTIVLYYIV